MILLKAIPQEVSYKQYEYIKMLIVWWQKNNINDETRKRIYAGVDNQNLSIEDQRFIRDEILPEIDLFLSEVMHDKKFMKKIKEIEMLKEKYLLEAQEDLEEIKK